MTKTSASADVWINRIEALTHDAWERMSYREQRQMAEHMLGVWALRLKRLEENARARYGDPG
jgi:hypothetical protein